MSATASGPLAGIKIIELSSIGPAPFCGMLLADMGAELLRVVPPKAREAAMPLPDHLDPIWRGRSKLVLDLKSPGDVLKLLSILPHADALIEGYRPGVLERLGLAPSTCLEANPRLVIGRVTGWGQAGPLSQAAGHDPNYLALTGALYAIGPADRPPPFPLNILGDFSGGAMFLAVGLLAALLSARTTGRGQVIDAAMVDGVAALMGPIYGLRNHGMWNDARGGDMLNGGCPYATSYETSDGGYLAVIPLEPAFYDNFVKALGPDGVGLPDRADRRNWPALKERLTTLFRSRTRDEWAAIFDGIDACVAPILSLEEAPLHPHNIARKAFVGGDRPLPAPAPRFSETATAHAPMDLGAPAELLTRWGMAAAAVASVVGAS
ncbi:MAG: CaiB/BaiF CoA-transferase family protein [Xanthobacteraceae bacterium]|nr:CaiB/BaiF CoA-transferase family protein [Xanthobacteraceae bacterium]